MSRKKDDKEDSGWGGLAAAIGIGVAGVAGAIYVGKKIYDGVQEENAKTKAAEKERALRDVDSVSFRRRNERDREPERHLRSDIGWEPPIERDVQLYGYGARPDTAYRPAQRDTTSEIRTPDVIPKATSPYSLESRAASTTSSRPLQEDLMHYYDSYVDISSYKMARAENVVEQVKDTVLSYLKMKSKLKVSHLVKAGSTSEGLKVINPDEFDVQIFLNLDSDVLYIDGNTGVPDYVLVKFKNPDDPTYREFSSVESSLFGGENLVFDPKKVRSYFQGQIQKSINGFDQFEVHPSTSGPAIKLDIVYGDNNTEMSIDMVPIVVLGGKEIVAKPHPKTKHKQSEEEYAKYWRWSFTKQEKEAIERYPKDACHRKCLKIFKAIRENHPGQLGQFRSYIFKTALLHLMDEHSQDEWGEEQLTERFIDFLQYFIQCLKLRELPHYFVDDLNIFEDMSESALQNSMYFLSKKISRAKVRELLKSDRVTKV